ncbi:MAG: threonylcarbamoyl-AMP synthase [Chloroflexi bacterium]|nr:MAG: Sua5/YciO/YrdC/YwlC family protein [Chloroflexi bacterium OLB13]MBW7880447.1 threonylcarbamoyl-AMP synthase [Anaerolineae bacterium]MCC6565624.1 threonylcarbamoyl-AMP synthase [Chloroflexota bacterium]MEB2366610.1 L-threonylcarbamoyladenylate synthase [Chloroflexota bacterium]
MDYSAKTIIMHVDPAAPEPDVITKAAEYIRAGKLVAFPTETVYGLGANALDPEAVERVYRAKRRPANDPLITHIAQSTDLYRLADHIPAWVEPLAQAFWPGPLTLVLQRAAHVPSNLAAGLSTIAVRMPIHPVARALIEASKTPIAAPSANTFTRPSATTAAHVLEDLYGRVDVVIDGGPTTLGLESTVLDLTQDPPVVLRPGGVVIEDLRRLIPEVRTVSQYLGDADEASPSPGQLLRHYAPRARLMLYEGPAAAVRSAISDTAARYIANGRRVGILTVNEDAAHYTQLGARIIALGEQHDHAAIGRVLFGALRALDGQGVDVILAPLLDSEGLGAAIRDRLLRAAEGKVFHVGQPTSHEA